MLWGKRFSIFPQHCDRKMEALDEGQMVDLMRSLGIRRKRRLGFREGKGKGDSPET